MTSPTEMGARTPGRSIVREAREAVRTAGRGSIRPRLQNEVGGGLLEMVVAVAVVAVLLGGVYLVLVSNQRIYARGQVSFDMHTNARFALPPITRTLLSAGLDPTEEGTFGFVDNPDAGYVPVASDTQLTFTLDANGDGALQSNGDERQGFRLTGAGPPFTLERMVIDGAGVVRWVPIAQQIQNFQFFYFDAASNPLPDPATAPYVLTAAERALIRRVVVQVTVAETGEGFVRGRQYRYTLSSAVTPRNLRGL